ncbi:MAG: hypothetical protein WCJ58_06755, partial [bacterium]
HVDTCSTMLSATCGQTCSQYPTIVHLKEKIIMARNNVPMPAPRIGDLWVNPNTNAILNDPSEISNPSLL